MKLKNLYISMILAIFILLLIPNISNASLYLNNLDFTMNVQSNGNIDIVETWDIEISDTNTLYKTFDLDREKYSSMKNFSVEEINDIENWKLREYSTWEYHIPEGYYFGGVNQDGNYEVAWGVNIDSTTTENKKYKISYTVIDGIKKYEDCAELYWQVIGNRFEINAKKITGTINLPATVNNKEELKIWGHTKYLNGEIYAIDNKTIFFEVNNYRAKEYVEVRALMPTYLFPNKETININKTEEVIQEETKWAEEANARRSARDRNYKIVFVISIIIIILETIWFIIKTKKYILALKEYPKQKPETNYEYYRELPDETATPTEASFIFNSNLLIEFPKIFSAIILDLALKKYIEIKPDKKTIEITLLDKEKESLEQDELKVLELLETVSKDKRLTMKQLEKYIEIRPNKLETLKFDFEKIAKKQAEKKQIFDSKLSEKSTKYMLGTVGYIFAIIINVSILIAFGLSISSSQAGEHLFKYILMFTMINFAIITINMTMTSILSHRLIGFTQKGINEQNKWKAFKKYMEDFSLLNEKEVPQLVLWEKYLVYATAFGIAGKVLKQLKVKYAELSDSSYVNDMVLFNVLYNGNGINTNFISSLNTSTSHMYSSTYSSGSGGGGGFSGGGGGRRPVVEAGGGR